MSADLYRALGLTQSASLREIKAAFRRLAKHHHPDHGGDPDEFRLIEQAYDVLSDDARRATYDAGYVDGAALLDEVLAMLKEYVVFPSEHAAVAVTLYAAATHAVSRLEFAARLVIKSPVKRCGKSRLLDVLGQLVADPLMTANISAAALVHSIDAVDPPTIILDEADATFGKALRADEKAEALRGLLNAGFTRDRLYRRYNPNTRQVEETPTFAMAILAGIGAMPDTIEDRAVIITMRRRAGSEEVKRFRLRRDKPRVREVGDRLREWVTPRSRAIGDAEPTPPDALNDRAQDAWEALIAVADAAGGEWPSRARTAALALAGEAEDDSLAVQLLSDVRTVFGDLDRLHTADILAGLQKIEESPWSSMPDGRALDAYSLATNLKGFGVMPSKTPFRMHGKNGRGYERYPHLHEAFDRYLAPESDQSGQGACNKRNSVTAQVSGPPIPPVTDVSVTPGRPSRSEQARYDVTDVTQPMRGRGHPTPEAVLERIIALHMAGTKGSAIARDIGVGIATVSRTIKDRCRDHQHGGKSGEAT